MTEPISVTVSTGVAISAKSTSQTPGDHVAVFNLAADGGTNNAGLNVVSANTAFSACEVSGHETAHGTLKISSIPATPPRSMPTPPPSASTCRQARREVRPPKVFSLSPPPKRRRARSCTTSIPTA
jgi:hypothetical protein